MDAMGSSYVSSTQLAAILLNTCFAATLFEFVLFGMVVYKSAVSSSAKVKINGRLSLTAILLHGNIVYFFW